MVWWIIIASIVLLYLRRFALFLQLRLFIFIGIVASLFLAAYLFDFVMPIAQIGLATLLGLILVEAVLLFIKNDGLIGRRETADKFSNGDENPIYIHLENRYGFTVSLRIIDEVPIQFQLRKLQFYLQIPAKGNKSISYHLRPVERGEYHFGAINVFVSTALGLVSKRYQFDQESMIPTYPSYLQMRKYQLMAISNRLTEVGVKKIRRLGHTTEFEQIKSYVRGDDVRTVNWKATARTGKLMVNQYTDERAQHVYCLIDKGRVMKMPFEGLSLLDYAINAALVISNIAIYKHDKAGLITFSKEIDSCVMSSDRPTQMNLIQEVLYNQETEFLEADYKRLYGFIKRKLTHRSLLILFTNFESLSALRRQLPMLKKLTRLHLLMVIIFENTELSSLLDSEPQNVEDIYIKTMGETFAFEKYQIIKEMEQHGIIAMLTPPAFLTVNTLNKYLELKARGMI